MTTYLPITKAREELTSLPEQLGAEPGTIAVTRRGQPVLAILPWELYESLQETLEILSDGELMGALRVSLQEADRDETESWGQARTELGG